MKDNIISINLETSTAPVVTEVRGRDWISYGDANGEWANLYPQFIIDLYYSSSISAAIINATADMINGKDIIIDDEDDRDLEARVKLQHFMDRANSNETLHEVLKKVAFDFKLQGAYALNIVWSKDRTQIAEIYHIPVEKIRVEKPDELGKVRGYFVSNDWTNTRANKPYRVPAFNANDRTSANQILYTGLYSPNMNAYYTPDYVSCNNWALIDSRVSEYHLNNISNGFSGSFMISFANGIPTAEERNDIERSLAAKFTGANNAGKFILTFSDDKTRVPEITPISPDKLSEQYLALQEMLTANIMSGHRVTSPMLMGIKNDTGLGNNADELNSAANFYLNSVVMPYQHQILKTLSKIFKINNMDMSVSFVQLKPITLEFTSEDLKGILTESELREEMGLAPLDVEVREDFSKVGMVDGKPVFSTIEEAEAHAKTLGCVGYHEHDLDGTTAYMACEGHEEATELSKFIEEFGEDIPEEWELVEEEVVDGEHQDFDFEEVLNDAASEKIELASTGSPKPSRKSEQDGISKKTSDYFRVRYVYENDNFLTNKSGTKRKFCRQMMGAKKLYRKEDIINMGKKAVNPGFGINGAATYSIWLYKGGPQCFHFWTRRIFKTVIGESKTTKIEDADLIGYTKARSEGFTAKKNDKLVAIPPRKMKNNGYYN
jgi:hypothetical protein|tara:strand:+ start:706 stop:2694 length:1989 start_codon:yes stop_codon:yes gene_type:complete